jgi:uncharacterized membrane protein YphA (DoxX/SURF4 family)
MKINRAGILNAVGAWVLVFVVLLLIGLATVTAAIWALVVAIVTYWVTDSFYLTDTR